MDFSAECIICHVVREIRYFEYDPVKGWICIDCKAAMKPAIGESFITPSRSINPEAGVQAGQAVEVRA